ncbi:MAG: ATP-binding cassette domain-containing protein [Myxococcales bacterium]|nr:ATP-binding cassette domain-containing protein [Myxococcota bacterium]MDW8281968.1 ATP-binding cassette domain-containing protein [Myxococcales bacterium]
MIEFRNIWKSFGGQVVLRGIDLRVMRGEILFIIGASGVGKSVTIKHVVGLIRPDRGEILLDGQRIDDLDERHMYAVRRRCAMVFQHSTLLDSMTVLDNVALPLIKHRRLSSARAREQARAYLDRVQMSEFADLLPAALSDGMRKRVAIARALTMEPEYILFDEPTTGLDPVSARRVDALIRGLSRDLGVTTVVVSHDLTSIFSIADRIAFLYQGKVHALGTPDQLRRSTDEVVQQFISGRAEGPMETPGF